jgi:Mg2+/citrate symporter
MRHGLQVQRTELAWVRTTLSCWAVALLTTKIAFPYGALSLAGPTIVSAINYMRWRRLREDHPPRRLSVAEAGLLTVACVVLAVGCLMV